jgi:PAS domain S-box-containing protein
VPTPSDPGIRLDGQRPVRRVAMRGGTACASAAAGMPMNHVALPKHEVRFYADGGSLAASVAGFLGGSLSRGGGGLLIATSANRQGICDELLRRRIDVPGAIAERRLVALDAEETLGRFMVDGAPDPERFAETVASIARDCCARLPAVRAYGEMVDVLAAAGDHTAALVLEELWNELLAELPVHLLCGYRLDHFGREHHGIPFRHICAAHTHVLPTEAYAALDAEDHRQRKIAELQQQAASLRAEVAERRRVEAELRRAEREAHDLFEHAAVGFHLIAGDGTIQRVNRAELELLGYAREEYLGRNIAEFHADPGTIADMLQRLAAGETMRSHRARLRCRDGSIRHVLIDADVRWEDGRFVHIRCSTRDITDQVRGEAALEAKAEQLARADEELRRVPQGAAHHLQESLRAITQHLALIQLLGADQLDERLRRCIDYALGGAERMRELIDALPC